MKTLNKFLVEEVVPTKRVGIQHFQNMKNDEFLEFGRDLLKYSGGKLKNIKISLKVDGSAGRFGKDTNGKFFFETSYSGPIQKRNAFEEYHKIKGTTDLLAIQRGVHWDKIYDILSGSKFMNAIPKNTKVVCELLYNPMATETEEGLSFIKIPYDKSKLGSLMTIVIIDVLYADKNEEREDGDEIEKALLKYSNTEIKIVSGKLGSYSFDLKGALEPLEMFTDEMMSIMKSRKKVDATLKAEYNAIFQIIKDEVATLIIKNPKILNTDKLGKKYEGLVFQIGGKVFKITTDDYKDLWMKESIFDDDAKMRKYKSALLKAYTNLEKEFKITRGEYKKFLDLIKLRIKVLLNSKDDKDFQTNMDVLLNDVVIPFSVILNKKREELNLRSALATFEIVVRNG